MDEKTYVFGNDSSSIPAWAAFMNGNNNGLFGNGSGWGGGILGFFLGLLFGNGWGGFGGFGNTFSRVRDLPAKIVKQCHSFPRFNSPTAIFLQHCNDYSTNCVSVGFP